MLGNSPRKRRFVVARFSKGHGKYLRSHPQRLDQERYEQRRVNASTEECSYRHVGNQVFPQALDKRLFGLFQGFRFGPTAGGPIPFPVPSSRHSLRGNIEPRSRFELLNSSEKSFWQEAISE